MCVKYIKKIYAVTVLLLAATVCSFGQDREQVIALLNGIDEIKSRGWEIIYMEEFNFGIQGGTNWLIEWKKDRSIAPFMYVVDIDAFEIKFCEQAGGRSVDYRPRFLRYYESLPGVTRGDGTYQVGDFNGDGFDEIMEFTDGAPSSREFYISGYDPQDGEIKTYCSVPWSPVGEDFRIPVEFIMYKGMQGFQAYYSYYDKPGNEQWFFYTWDGERREYVEIGVVDPKYIGVEAEPVQTQNVPVPPPPEESPSFAAAAESSASAAVAEEPPVKAVYSNSPIVLIIILIAAAVAVAVAVILFAVRKRRKN